MESIIDIQLVKEQLRLLGHDVADEVILEFVKGLNTRTVDQQAPTSVDQKFAAVALEDGFRDASPALPSSRPASSKAPSRQQVTLATQVQSSTVQRSQHNPDAAPSQIRQAPDQQSPKRLPAADADTQDQTSPPAPYQQQHTALDKRCRTFLARGSDKPAPQSEQQRPMLLQMPRLHDRALVGIHSSSQLSAAESSQLVLGSAELDSDSSAEDGLCQRDHSSKHVLSYVQPQQLQAAGSWVLRQSQQQSQQEQQQQQSHLAVGLAGHQEICSSAGDSSHVSDSDGDDGIGLEAEGSKFLLHQAATMQRVRARLAAKMAGYTAAAGAAASIKQEQQQQQQVVSNGPGVGGSSNSSSANAHSSSSSTGAAADSSSDLPRFGFRPGYKPVGIHMPPPPSAAAVQALTAARALRQQAAGPAASGGDRAAAVQKLALDLHHLDSSAAHQSSQQQHSLLHGATRADPTFGPAVGLGVGGGSLHLVTSPGKAACSSALGGARSGASIIGGETPPCLVAAGSKPRQSPRVDPLYMAPLSPRRSNSATPRSSPARSPAALVPMPPAGLNVMRSPAGVAPASASAAVPAARSSRQSLSFSAGSRGAPRADPQREEQQQHKLATGAGRRASSAPPSPASAAPRGTVRAPSVGGASSSGTSSRPGSTRSSQGVSHQSLYCQKLAYSNVRGTVAPGVCKTDRVARFQLLQQQWARDRFLCSGAGGAVAKMSTGAQHS